MQSYVNQLLGLLAPRNYDTFVFARISLNYHNNLHRVLQELLKKTYFDIGIK